MAGASRGESWLSLFPKHEELSPPAMAKGTPVQPHDVPRVERPPRPPVKAVASAPPELPEQTLLVNQRSPSRDMYPGGPSDIGFGTVEDEDDEDTPTRVHVFPLPVRVLSFLLDSSILTPGRDSLTSIATSSCVDDTGEALLYCVHLESGYSLEINVGFLEIILPHPEGQEVHIEPTNDLVESQCPMHGRYSSSEEETDDEVDENQWPTEMTYNPDFSNFPFNCHDTGGWRVGDDSDSEIERAAESLQGDRNLGGDQIQRQETVRGRGGGVRRDRMRRVGQCRGQVDVDAACMHADRDEGSAQGPGGGSVSPRGAACDGAGSGGTGGPNACAGQGSQGPAAGEWDPVRAGPD
jgi:hypothetical protein